MLIISSLRYLTFVVVLVIEARATLLCIVFSLLNDIRFSPLSFYSPLSLYSLSSRSILSPLALFSPLSLYSLPSRSILSPLALSLIFCQALRQICFLFLIFFSFLFDLHMSLPILHTDPDAWVQWTITLPRYLRLHSQGCSRRRMANVFPGHHTNSLPGIPDQCCHLRWIRAHAKDSVATPVRKIDVTYTSLESVYLFVYPLGNFSRRKVSNMSDTFTLFYKASTRSRHGRVFEIADTKLLKNFYEWKVFISISAFPRQIIIYLLTLARQTFQNLFSVSPCFLYYMYTVSSYM